MKLAALHISGDSSRIMVYQEMTSEIYIMKSWKQSTRKQYNSHIESWFKFCRGKDNFIKPNISTVLAYLTSLYNKGLGYSSINTAWSAINSFLNLCRKVNINNNGRVSRFMKEVFNDRPALP